MVFRIYRVILNNVQVIRKRREGNPHILCLRQLLEYFLVNTPSICSIVIRTLYIVFNRGDPQTNIHFKVHFEGDPQNTVRFNVNFEGDPQNIVLSNVNFESDPQNIVPLKPYFHSKKH